MKRKKNILALIPARGGSKGILKKNIVNLGGYPLMAYSIAAAKLSKYITRTIVTTDDEGIAAVSRGFGAEVPFLRPERISRDASLDKDFFLHALRWLKKNEGYVPDLVVHLRPTTPLRDIRVIDMAIMDMEKDRKATSLRSAEVIEKESPYKLFKKKGLYYDFFGKEDFKKGEEYYNYPRQKFPVTYQPNGYVDVIRPSILLSTGSLHGKYIRAFITEHTAEIDYVPDLKDAEISLSKPQYGKLINELRKKTGKRQYG